MSAPRAVIEFHDSEDDSLTIKLLLDGDEKRIPHDEMTQAQAYAVELMRLIGKLSIDNAQE